MNTVIEMAKECGFVTGPYGIGVPPSRISINDTTDAPWMLEALERFADLVRAGDREATNNAYRERNQLVALLSTLFPSGKAKTAIEGWDEAWHGCVYIDFPWGQASWHYHTDDEWMFEHLPPYTEEWDGHTTEAKYGMIAAAIRARSNNDK